MISVSTKEGQIAFTRMLRAPYSTAADLVSPITPCFENWRTVIGIEGGRVVSIDYSMTTGLLHEEANNIVHERNDL